MRRIFIATLMALIFGLFSMPTLQAAPANGLAFSSAIKASSPLLKIRRVRRRRRRRRRHCGFRHYRRSRMRWRCWWR